MRSDRAQNSRTEALNLIRNRKGRVPHIVVVTGEPLPSRLSSLALGTGDIDCMYHFALYELIEAVHEYGRNGREDIVELILWWMASDSRTLPTCRLTSHANMARAADRRLKQGECSV